MGRPILSQPGRHAGQGQASPDSGRLGIIVINTNSYALMALFPLVTAGQYPARGQRTGGNQG
jgi:hypothetical protein